MGLEKEFIEAIRYLDEVRGVSVISADCGFFAWFQALARQHTAKPVVASSLAMLPSIASSIGDDGRIAIFTANSTSLAPMHDTVKRECGVDWNRDRRIIVGCQDV